MDPEKPYGESIRFLLEIVADAFDLRYGFLSHTDLYLKTVWHYLLSEHKSNLTIKINDYITRSISALRLNEIIMKKEYPVDRSDNAKSIKDFISHLNTLGINLQGFKINIENIEYNLSVILLEFIRFLAKIMNEDSDTVRAMQSYFKMNDFLEIVKNTQQGFVYTQKIEYPHLLILRFLHLEKIEGILISTAAKLALIKTLWYQSLFHSAKST